MSHTRYTSTYINDNEMTLISVGFTSPALATPDNIFRLLPDGTQQPLIFRLMEMDGATALITVYRNDSWGVALTEGMADTFGGVHKMTLYVPGTDDCHMDKVVRAAYELAEHDIAILLVGLGDCPHTRGCINRVITLAFVAWD